MTHQAPISLTQACQTDYSPFRVTIQKSIHHQNATNLLEANAAPDVEVGAGVPTSEHAPSHSTPQILFKLQWQTLVGSQLTLRSSEGALFYQKRGLGLQ